MDGRGRERKRTAEGMKTQVLNALLKETGAVELDIYAKVLHDA